MIYLSIHAGERRASGPEICSLIAYHVKEFDKLKRTKGQMGVKSTLKWEPPPQDMYRINIDASFKVSTQAGGWGFVARNNIGEFLEGGCGNLERVSSPLQAEAQAALMSLRRVAELGINRIILKQMQQICRKA